MIKQSLDTLYTLEELVELLKNNKYIVLGIDEWYLHETGKYYEVSKYDFSECKFSNEQISDLVVSNKLNTNADFYSVVLAD